jgi:hypothetical protein
MIEICTPGWGNVLVILVAVQHNAKNRCRAFYPVPPEFTPYNTVNLTAFVEKIP